MTTTLELPASAGEALLIGGTDNPACPLASPLLATPSISKDIGQIMLGWPADVLSLAELSPYALNALRLLADLTCTTYWLQI